MMSVAQRLKSIATPVQIKSEGKLSQVGAIKLQTGHGVNVLLFTCRVSNLLVTCPLCPIKRLNRVLFMVIKSINAFQVFKQRTNLFVKVASKVHQNVITSPHWLNVTVVC